MSFRVLGQVTFFRRMIYDGRSRSLTGAWIETRLFTFKELLYSVAPLRGRGLKLRFPTAGCPSLCVAPLRGRGLKPHGGCTQHPTCGRSLTGAWIETICRLVLSPIDSRRSLTGAWIETVNPIPFAGRVGSLPYGGVD